MSEIGPSLLGRILELNGIQEGTLEIAFKMADDQGLLLLDLDDLRALLGFVAERRKEISTQYGLVSSQTVASIQRALLTLEREGGDVLFGEPGLELGDLVRTDLSERGIVSILAADRLTLKPRLYSSLLLWLLSELFENLPEVGDLDWPRLVFMVDEAHLPFDDAPPATSSGMGAITPDERAVVRTRSPVGAKYDAVVNRESAYEILSRRAAPAVATSAPVGSSPAGEPEKKRGALGEFLWGTKRRQGMVETMAKQAARTVGSQVGRQILRGVLGGIFGGTRRGSRPIKPRRGSRPIEPRRSS